MRATQDVDVLSSETGESDESDESTIEHPGRRSPRGLRLALPIALTIVVIDQITKIWAENRLTAGSCSAAPDACIDLFLDVRFHLVYNRGAAFSTGTRLGPLFGVIAMVMAVVLLNLARRRADRLGVVLLAVIAGGAIGNLIDRIVRADDGLLTGAVIDFVDVQWWPVFNVADAAVVVGVVVFIVYTMFIEPGPDQDSGHSETDGDDTETDGDHTEAATDVDDSPAKS